MSIDRRTVEYVANLSRIDLSEEELKTLSGQLTGILDFIDTLRTVDTERIAPTSHILPISNVLREDLPAPSLTPEKALENAPQKQEGFYGVPKVIE